MKTYYNKRLMKPTEDYATYLAYKSIVNGYCSQQVRDNAKEQMNRLEEKYPEFIDDITTEGGKEN